MSCSCNFSQSKLLKCLLQLQHSLSAVIVLRLSKNVLENEVLSLRLH